MPTRASFLCSCVAFVAMCAALASEPAFAQPPHLLVDSPSTKGAVPGPQNTKNLTIGRSRNVTIDLRQLRPPGPALPPPAEVTLNLFPDVAWTAALDRIEASATGSVWVGHIPSVPLSTVTLSVVDDMLHGSIFTPGGTYIIHPSGNGLHEVLQVGPSQAGASVLSDTIAVAPARSGVVAQTDASEVGPTASPDDGSIIDIMVLYTPAAEAAAGGSTAIAALINNAIAVTNASYANSGVEPRVRLASAGPVAYVETGAMYTDLYNVTFGVGTLSGVGALRDTYHADLVTMLTANSTECARSWVNLSPYYGTDGIAYSVVDQACAVSQLSFPQAISANMGARTDWYSDYRYGSSSFTPYYINPDMSLGGYAHAYVNVPGRWRTLNATNALCAAYGVSCTLLPYWSNPDLVYGGAPMGVPVGTASSASCGGNVANPRCDADERRTLNENAWLVANFRSTSLVVRYFGGSLTGTKVGDTWNFWAITGSGTAPLSYKFWVYDGSTWSVGQDWSTASTFNWAPTLPGHYTLQVWARNAGSTNTYDSWLGTTARVAPRVPLVASYVMASDTQPLYVGKPMYWYTYAREGTSPYTFKFWLFNGSSWTVLRDWSTSSSANWTPPSPGTYTVQAWVRNAGSTANYDAWVASVPTVVAPTPAPSLYWFTASPSTVRLGSPMSLSAYAYGGLYPYSFKFWAFDGTSWTVLHDWSSTDYINWTPPAAGTYRFQVWVRNAGSTSTYDTWSGIGPYQVTAPPALSVTSVQASRPSPSPVGTPITFATSASGGTSPYTYRFYLFNGSTWVIGQDWSSVDTWTWSPSAPGTYSLQVWVRNAGSGATYDAWKGLGPITITP